MAEIKSEAIRKIDKFKRDMLKDFCHQCSEAQLHIFKQMYSHKDLQKPIDDIINDMPYEKLEWAIQQAENTVIKNNENLINKYK